MGRRPDPKVAELKADIRNYLDEALDLPFGLVFHADSQKYVLSIAKQVKTEDQRWTGLIVRPGEDAGEIWIVRKEPDFG